VSDPQPGGLAAAASGFDRLHPSVQHHVVNSLGWRSLRPLQTQTIDPVLDGDHVMATAPTAGGKTEAAVLPLLSRMLTEDWTGLSVLYLCPLRALLNNLQPRLEGYAALVGRTCALWHGDVGAAERRRLLADPPDILLTTPESLEAMLVSTGIAHDRWFANLQAVVIDEVHAFANDDRGWHLLAVLARVGRLSGRELQRVALSATVGNPIELLAWMTAPCHRPGRVVAAPAETRAQPEITLDYVGGLANAAIVISRLHRGEKRLVFVDSRSRAERLAFDLAGRGVTTFVSHGSLSASQRRLTETAFAEARDCVIVATSTLELGIDVGDLDRVIQIDSPPSVASFLQRLGRSGRRAGTMRAALFLATTDDALERSAGMLLAWSRGYVEPVTAPTSPYHLVAQQLLALSLQEHGVGRHLWTEWLGTPFALGADAGSVTGAVTDHLLAEGYLADSGGGVLGVGQEAEAAFGRRSFMELLSVFTSPPVFSVRHGAQEIGHVPDEALLARPSGLSAGGAHALVLAGRSWLIRDIDWTRRVVSVEPADVAGVARWQGAGQPLGAVVARAVRDVLAGEDPGGVILSERAIERLAARRAERPWVTAGGTTLLTEAGGRTRWWTFAGWKANLALGFAASSLRTTVAAIDDLSVALDPGTSLDNLRAVIAGASEDRLDIAPWVVADAIEGLKFAECLPDLLARTVITRRLADPVSVRLALGETVGGWRDGGG
jgi:ATP-dependent Lhr-like helicase